MKDRELSAHSLDPRAAPPQRLREVYKRYQKLQTDHLVYDDDVLDPATATSQKQRSCLEQLHVLDGLLVKSAEESIVKSFDVVSGPNESLQYVRYGVTGLPGELLSRTPQGGR